MTEADKMRARWARAQPVLDELDRRDREAHLSLSIEQRLLRTIELGEGAIRWCGERLRKPDDEHLVWQRVHDLLHSDDA